MQGGLHACDGGMHAQLDMRPWPKPNGTPAVSGSVPVCVCTAAIAVCMFCLQMQIAELKGQVEGLKAAASVRSQKSQWAVLHGGTRC